MNDKTPRALLVTLLGTLATLAGVSGVTQADLTGFVDVVGVLISLFGIIWAHVSHKSTVSSLQK